jgi:hypothetical protein
LLRTAFVSVTEPCGVLAIAVRISLAARMEGGDLLGVDDAFFNQSRI